MKLVEHDNKYALKIISNKSMRPGEFCEVFEGALITIVFDCTNINEDLRELIKRRSEKITGK